MELSNNKVFGLISEFFDEGLLKISNLFWRLMGRRANDIPKSEERIVNFHDLVLFVKSKADIATAPVFYPHVLKAERKGERKKLR